MKIALAHDSLTQLGGAEKVLDDLHALFPEAPVYVLVWDKNLHQRYRGWDIRTSWLQPLYNILPKLQYFLPLIPAAVGSFDFTGYDAVISSSSSWIKNIIVPKTSVHVNYCHTPTRFLWSDRDYVDQEVPWALKPFAKLFLAWMKKWDYGGAQRVNFFIANSREVQARIRAYYHRESEIIYPGVDTNFWHPTVAKQNYFLIVGRLQAHKRNDLIIEIFNKLGLPLHVAGTGRQEKYLKSIAKSNIKFLGRISDEQLRDEYSGARALIFPQVEDFGLVPLEAAACGTASIGIAKGGSLETVVPGLTGELFESYTQEKIQEIIVNWNPDKYLADSLILHAQKFCRGSFKRKILELINLKAS